MKNSDKEVSKGGSPKEIKVYLDGDEKTIADGSYTMDQLVDLLEAPAGYVLSVKHGEGRLEPMEAGKPLKIHPNMKFISQPPQGDWA